MSVHNPNASGGDLCPSIIDDLPSQNEADDYSINNIIIVDPESLSHGPGQATTNISPPPRKRPRPKKGSSTMAPSSSSKRPCVFAISETKTCWISQNHPGPYCSNHRREVTNVCFQLILSIKIDEPDLDLDLVLSNTSRLLGAIRRDKNGTVLCLTLKWHPLSELARTRISTLIQRHLRNELYDEYLTTLAIVEDKKKFCRAANEKLSTFVIAALLVHQFQLQNQCHWQMQQHFVQQRDQIPTISSASGAGTATSSGCAALDEQRGSIG